MRAVAQEGVELIEGVHLNSEELVITIKQSNGIVREVPYHHKDIATPVLVEAMILDKGIKSPEIREAVRRYCLTSIKEMNELIAFPEKDGITIGEFYSRVEAFEAGYKAAS